MRKSNKKPTHNEMRDEYDFSSGVRGKYTSRFAQGSNVVVLDPDVARVFPDSQAVNRALRVLSEAAKRDVRDRS